MNDKNAILYIVEGWSTHSPRTGRFGSVARITRTSDAASVVLADTPDNAACLAKALSESEGGRFGYPSVYQMSTISLAAREFASRSKGALCLTFDAPVGMANGEREAWMAQALRTALDKSKEA